MELPLAGPILNSLALLASQRFRIQKNKDKKNTMRVRYSPRNAIIIKFTASRNVKSSNNNSENHYQYNV